MNDDEYEFNEKKDITKVFTDICNANNQIIKLGQKIIPFCFLVYPKTIKIISINTDLEKFKQEIIKKVSEKKLVGYIVVIEGKFAGYNKVVLRNLYTKHYAFKEIVYRSDKDIISKKIIEGRKNFPEDSLDYWGNFNTNKDMVIKK